MANCTNCGAELLDTSKFCPHCGTPVAADLSQNDADVSDAAAVTISEPAPENMDNPAEDILSNIPDIKTIDSVTVEIPSDTDNTLHMMETDILNMVSDEEKPADVKAVSNTTSDKGESADIKAASDITSDKGKNADITAASDITSDEGKSADVKAASDITSDKGKSADVKAASDITSDKGKSADVKAASDTSNSGKYIARKPDEPIDEEYTYKPIIIEIPDTRKKKKSKAGIIIAVIVIILLAVLAGAYVVSKMNSTSVPDIAETVTSIFEDISDTAETTITSASAPVTTDTSAESTPASEASASTVESTTAVSETELTAASDVSLKTAAELADGIIITPVHQPASDMDISASISLLAEGISPTMLSNDVLIIVEYSGEVDTMNGSPVVMILHSGDTDVEINPSTTAEGMVVFEYSAIASSAAANSIYPPSFDNFSFRSNGSTIDVHSITFMAG